MGALSAISAFQSLNELGPLVANQKNKTIFFNISGVDFNVLLNNSKARPSNDIEVEGFVAKN